MTSPKTPSGAKMLPYRRQGEIDYANLEFDPNEKNVTPDAMEQNLELAEILGLFRARFTDFNQRPDVFLDNETFICYDPSNLNVRAAPDILSGLWCGRRGDSTTQNLPALGGGKAARLGYGNCVRKYRQRGHRP